MKPEVLMKFKNLFETQKKGLIYSYKLVNEDFALQPEDMSDEIDLSSVEVEQGMRLRLRSREAFLLRKIDETLAKIQAGTFGVCEDCGDQISLSRLEARPTAAFCLSCKEEQELFEQRSADGRLSKSAGRSVFSRTA